MPRFVDNDGWRLGWMDRWSSFQRWVRVVTVSTMEGGQAKGTTHSSCWDQRDEFWETRQQRLVYTSWFLRWVRQWDRMEPWGKTDRGPKMAAGLSPEHRPYRSRTQMTWPGWREGGKCGATPVKVQSLGSSNTFHILLTCPEQEVRFDPLQPVPPLLKWYLHYSLFTVSDCHCQHCFLLETGDERIRHMIKDSDH